MPITTYKTRVIMDSGNQYIFNEHPEDFIKRFYEEESNELKAGLIHGVGFSILSNHISSVEDIEETNNNTEYDDEDDDEVEPKGFYNY